MDDSLLPRFERYFAHPADDHAIIDVGISSVACLNIRRAIGMTKFGERSPDSDLFDDVLRERVMKFQENYRHRVVDGLFGPGTRRLLVTTLLAEHGPGAFRHLKKPKRAATVFISYAWKDSEKVDKLDQWLSDHDVVVIRDERDFLAGDRIEGSIRTAVALSDRVLAIYSRNSSGRHWPTFETFVAGEIERVLEERLLIYVRLDETSPPETASGRLHVNAQNEPLKRVGERLLQAIVGDRLPANRHEYDEGKPL